MARLPDHGRRVLAGRLVETPFLRPLSARRGLPSLQSVAMNDFDTHPTRAPVSDLTRRERQVLEMTSKGMSNGQMASNLNLTTHAVKFHLASVYRKLGVANRTEAAVVFLRWQGATLDDALGVGD